MTGAQGGYIVLMTEVTSLRVTLRHYLAFLRVLAFSEPVLEASA